MPQPANALPVLLKRSPTLLPTSHRPYLHQQNTALLEKRFRVVIDDVFTLKNTLTLVDSSQEVYSVPIDPEKLTKMLASTIATKTEEAENPDGLLPSQASHISSIEDDDEAEDGSSSVSSPVSRRQVALSNTRIAIQLNWKDADHPRLRLDPYVMPTGYPQVPTLMLPSTCYGAIEFQNPRYKEVMEDISITGRIDIERPGDYPLKGSYFGIFDGHGLPVKDPITGNTPGRDLAIYFSQAIPTLFKQKCIESGGDLPISLLRAFKQADLDSKSDPKAQTSGSTGLFVFIPDRSPDIPWEMLVANCGDSRVLVCHEHLVQQVTVDHNFSQTKTSEYDRIRAAGIQIHKQRAVVKGAGGLNMTRTLGNWLHAGNGVVEDGHRGGVSGTPDIFIVPLLGSDTQIVLGCDGLFDTLSNQDIALAIQSKVNPWISAQTIVTLAGEKGAFDNLSVIVVSLKDIPTIPSLSSSKSTSKKSLKRRRDTDGSSE